MPRRPPKGASLPLTDGSILIGDKDVLHKTEIDALDDELNSGDLHEDRIPSRRLHELPVVSDKAPAVALVVFFTLWGLNAEDISELLGVPYSRVVAAKDSDGYSDFMRQVVESIRAHDQTTVAGYISSHARVAAKKIGTLIHDRTKDIALAASKDMLDRAGHRPADRVEHQHRFDNELRIVYVEQTEIEMKKQIEL